MSKLVSASIDVNKIDKTKLVKGQKGTYLNITFSVNDEADQYGNHVSIWQGQTEDERKSKAARNFLGNGKVVWQEKAEAVTADPEDGLPF